MHRVLRVVAVRLDELGPVDALLAAHTEQALLLAVEIAEVPASRSPREDRRGERPQLVAEDRLRIDELVRHEQEQQDRRMSLEREPHVLAQAVRDEVEVARAGSDTLRLRPLDVVLEPVEASA